MESSNGSVRPHDMTFLFAQYMNGSIRETAWNRFMAFMDCDRGTSNDRDALAAFFKDALDEFGGDSDIFIPMLSEAGFSSDDAYSAAA